ncbi:hypothetical protein [Methylobacterium sp. NEAU K]|uniref:hypothetical protein n=1 Tax=Methylobacterium sp. NEAU K TaxID=3064946 RepID=UPI002736F50C|nr:hypothetical protein [Methylobacterium sp. NEAU K]MDP4005787.1 hypothetical protein [Methylobacterium sp. NEAU K]
MPMQPRVGADPAPVRLPRRGAGLMFVVLSALRRDAVGRGETRGARGGADSLNAAQVHALSFPRPTYPAR